MNKEYMYLDGGKIAITDENGSITKREVVGNEESVLMYENNVDRMQKIIEDSNLKILEKYNKANNWRIFSAATKLAGIYLFIAYYICLFASVSLSSTIFNCSIFLIIFGVGAGKYSKKQRKIINGLNNKLLIANTIKQEYEKELVKVKSDSPKNKLKYIKINEPIKVKENKLKIELEENRLNEAYDEGYSSAKKKIKKQR